MRSKRRLIWLRASGPGIDLGLRQLLPLAGGTDQRAWAAALDDLEARRIDIAPAPLSAAPTRFEAVILYDEDFVIAMRKGHAFGRKPTLERYCAMQHLIVSLTGDAHGLFDAALAKRGLSRRVVLTVSSFMQALAGRKGKAAD